MPSLQNPPVDGGRLPDTRERQRIARELTIILQQNGLLESAIRTAAQKQALTIEEIVRQRLAAGMSVENIRQELLDALASDTAGVFAEFRGDLKEAVYGAANEARALGMKTALVEGGMEKGWRWQSNGVNVCEDCQLRHGEIDTMANWIVKGLPTMWGSRCGTNDQCVLVETDMVLEPIRVGQEE